MKQLKLFQEKTTVKVLILWQSWVTLVALRLKQYETRLWVTSAARQKFFTSFRGLIVVFSPLLKKLATDGLFLPTWTSYQDKLLIHAAFWKPSELHKIYQPLPLNFWKLNKVPSLQKPIPVQGYQKLWTSSDELISQVLE